MLWSLGVTAVQTVFDGGRIRANVDFAQAGYEATVASYRRVVLAAMQEVEDGITGLAALERASAQAQSAVDAARQVRTMAAYRYEGGASTFLDVITAQQSLLAAERQLAHGARPAPANGGVPGEGAGRRLVRTASAGHAGGLRVRCRGHSAKQNKRHAIITKTIAAYADW